MLYTSLRTQITCWDLGSTAAQAQLMQELLQQNPQSMDNHRNEDSTFKRYMDLIRRGAEMAVDVATRANIVHNALP